MPPDVGLTTLYGSSLAVSVNDQFGNPLESMFNGATVKEQVPDGSWRSIIVRIANGSYADFVGAVFNPAVNPIVLSSSQAATNWVNPQVTAPIDPTAGTGLVSDTYAPQNIAVEIGGVQLQTGVVNRTIGWSEANGAVTLTVTW
jgi:hypothetical protein